MTNYQVFWQAKIWGLLHDPPLKGLYRNKSDEGPWQQLKCMENWYSPKIPSQLTNNQLFARKWLDYIGLSDLLASASDRAAIGRLPAPFSSISYDQDGIEIKHLLSGAKQNFKLGQWHEYLVGAKQSERDKFLQFVENNVIPEEIKQESDARKVYWWLWRCYPVALSHAQDEQTNSINETGLPLLPAETRLPDGSVWSHTTMTSALAGSLAGYFKNIEEYPKKGAWEKKDYFLSRPHVAVFSFSPVQELIKASRKMRDFWSGSWLLHYLSAKVCWDIAWKYGPDSLLYPCLYEQPLIDLWLLQKYPDFKQWIKEPDPQNPQRLLTAGFPNVIVMILPDNGACQNPYLKNPAANALQQAKQTLLDEWDNLGNRTLAYLKSVNPQWANSISQETWQNWLKFQWQFYSTALPIGPVHVNLHQSPNKKEAYQKWTDQQNKFAQPAENLFVEAESDFLKAVYNNELLKTWSERNKPNFIKKQPNLNVGSWWPSIFDQTRTILAAVKNARSWQIPTSFGPRSTISGLGPVLHPVYDQNKKGWATEGETAEFWQKNLGLFDGIEELNATEVLKRILGKILPELLFDDLGKYKKFDLYYPDLTGGAIGWLKQMEMENNQSAIDYFKDACQEVIDQFAWTKDVSKTACGIPWANNNQKDWLNPRFLNAGWLIDEYSPISKDRVLTVKDQREEIKAELGKLRQSIAKKFEPGNNPTDWYVLAAGDGDGMSEWLKGKRLNSYNHYIPEKLKPMIDNLPDDPNQKISLRHTAQAFLKLDKRMGPSTHSALSRALLDFSNVLVPYLTEERYAGRLIYGGGDDVLAYTNLWEWDNWLWDIRQCFRGDTDPHNQFHSVGDYWQTIEKNLPDNFPKNFPRRPLFTMGSKATISFGIVIAHHSVPLAIALENLWSAEAGAKDHESQTGKKDAVQVRVLYGNGNILKATTKFSVFDQWRKLIEAFRDIEPSIFEQAATIWEQHPAPVPNAIEYWANAFCQRREKLIDDQDGEFQKHLTNFIKNLWEMTPGQQLNEQVKNWLKLAAFVLRQRHIKIPDQSISQ